MASLTLHDRVNSKLLRLLEIKGGLNPKNRADLYRPYLAMLHPMTLLLLLKCCSLNKLSFGMLTL